MKPNEYDVVALTEDVSASHEESRQAITLRRGQVGTVVMAFDEACLIDFADNEGFTYAMETVAIEKLMVLFYEPALVVA
ncbi:MAG: DUF4926 domain-containing protein [Cyanobacteria bacterium P01_D01_bin.36]